MPPPRSLRAAVLVLASAVLLLPGTLASVPLCSSLAPGASGACPAAYCKSAAGPVLFGKCEACSKKTYMAKPPEVYCSKCKPGFNLFEVDSFQTECLNRTGLQCAVFDKELPGAAFGLVGPCISCPQGLAGVYATNAGTWEFTSDGYSAKRVCRSCFQLGCPGQCAPSVGCRSCPAGSVLIRTGPPAGTQAWIGNVPYYSVGKPAPTLPSICMRIQDLGCAAGKAANGVGCTACPAGRTRQPIRPQFIVGSSFVRFQLAGQACVA